MGLTKKTDSSAWVCTMSDESNVYLVSKVAELGSLTYINGKSLKVYKASLAVDCEIGTDPKANYVMEQVEIDVGNI